MGKNNYLSLLIYLINLLPALCISQNNSTWPFPNTGNITGTPGEMRDINGGINIRFHNGVDLTDVNGATAVFAINTGIISWNAAASSQSDGWNAVITVGNHIYKHVRIAQGLVQNSTVNAGTLIGNMFANTPQLDPHVHIQMNNNQSYFGNITPFQDHVAPNVHDFGANAWATNTPTNPYQNYENRHFIQFYRDGITNDNTTAQITETNRLFLGGINAEHTVLSGRVDMVCRARDARIDPQGGDPGIGNNAPHTIQYNFVQTGTGLQYGNVNAVNFNTLLTDAINREVPQNPANFVFTRPSTCCTQLNYIITTDFHNAPVQRYWNTKLRDGVTETWTSDNALNSTSNEDADFPDSRYEVGLEVTDAGNNNIAFNEPVIID